MRWLALLLLVAGERVVPEYDFAITLPDGWATIHPRNRPEGTLHEIAVQGEDRKSLVLRVSRMGDDHAADEAQFRAEVLRGLKDSSRGGRILKETRRPVAGRPADLVRWELDAGTPARFALASFVAGGRHYSLLAVAPGEGSDVDPEFTAALESFRFLASPAPAENDPAFRVGYWIGSGLFVLLLLAVAYRLARLFAG